jgi:hypothetical protein
MTELQNIPQKKGEGGNIAGKGWELITVLNNRKRLIRESYFETSQQSRPQGNSAAGRIRFN